MFLFTLLLHLIAPELAVMAFCTKELEVAGRDLSQGLDLAKGATANLQTAPIFDILIRVCQKPAVNHQITVCDGSFLGFQACP